MLKISINLVKKQNKTQPNKLIGLFAHIPFQNSIWDSKYTQADFQGIEGLDQSKSLAFVLKVIYTIGIDRCTLGLDTTSITAKPYILQ